MKEINASICKAVSFAITIISVGALALLLTHDTRTPESLMSVVVAFTIACIIPALLWQVITLGRHLLSTLCIGLNCLGLVLLYFYAASVVTFAFLYQPPTWLPLWLKDTSNLAGILLLVISGVLTLKKIKQENDGAEMRQAQAANDARFVKLIHDSATNIAIISTDLDGNISSFNHGAEMLYRTATANVIGTSIYTLFAANDTLAKQDASSLANSASLKHRKQILVSTKATGERFTCEATITRLNSDSQSDGGLLWLIADIQHTASVEKQLAESSEKLSKACQQARLGHWVADLESGDLWWSDIIYDIFGLKPNEVTPSLDLFNSFLHPDDEPLVRQSEQTAKQTGVHDVQHRIVLRDGRVRWVHERAINSVTDKTAGVVLTGTVQDITELMEARRNAEFAEKRNQQMISNLYDGLVVIDDQGMVIEFNRAACCMFGYQRDEVIGKNVSMLMPESDKSQHDGYLKSYNNTGIAQIIGIGRDVTALRANGTLFPMQLFINEIVLPDGSVNFLGTVRDLTKLKELEQLKSQFISTVSHELRTPLTSIAGSLAIVASGSVGELPEKAQRMINLAQRNSTRLVALVNDLLDFEKLSNGKMALDNQRCNIQTLIATCINTNQGFAESHNVSLTFDNSGIDLDIWVDPSRFEQILSNLLSNAIKYSPPGDTVTVALSRKDNSMTVSVRDNGPGIPESFQANLFDRFAQADASDARSKSGTGLGLAISKELASAMGLSLSFESEPGNGSCFMLNVPDTLIS